MAMDEDDLESFGTTLERPTRARTHAAMLACATVVAIAAVVVAIASAIIAYQEAQQTRYQRQQDCVAKLFASFPTFPTVLARTQQQQVDQARRRCYGLPPTATITAPKHATATAPR